MNSSYTRVCVPPRRENKKWNIGIYFIPIAFCNLPSIFRRKRHARKLEMWYWSHHLNYPMFENVLSLFTRIKSWLQCVQEITLPKISLFILAIHVLCTRTFLKATSHSLRRRTRRFDGPDFGVGRRIAVQLPLQHFQRRIHLSDLVSFFGSSSLFLLNIFPENGFRI